jgi:hypothetical protein
MLPTKFRPDPLTNMATTGDSCFWLADFFNSSSLKPLSQMIRNLVGIIYGRSSIMIANFVPIHQQTWPPQAILVSDWYFFLIFTSETTGPNDISVSSFGWGVSEEKIKMWKDNGRQTTDVKWWKKLTLPLARWVNKLHAVLILFC